MLKRQPWNGPAPASRWTAHEPSRRRLAAPPDPSPPYTRHATTLGTTSRSRSCCITWPDASLGLAGESGCLVVAPGAPPWARVGGVLWRAGGFALERRDGVADGLGSLGLGDGLGAAQPADAA